MRLGTSVFAGGTQTAPADARESVPSLRLVVEEEEAPPLSPALPLRSCDSPLYLPSSRVNVSLSPGFPRGLCFFDHPSSRRHAVWPPAAGLDHPAEHPGWLLRSCCPFGAVTGALSPAGSGGEVKQQVDVLDPSVSHVRFGQSLFPRVGSLNRTMVHLRVRLRSP